jgi:hypothetical protein
MHRRALTVSLVSFAAALGAPAVASASGSPACGNIDLSNVHECHLVWSAGCQGSCDPSSFALACDAQCTASVSAACTGECQTECLTSCTVDPGQFDCEASCVVDCRARAETHCGCDGQSTTEIEARCSAECQAKCEIVPPSASCDTKCSSCCNASCQVEANASCVVSCTAEMDANCQVDCQASGGALFCDGQYIPVEDLDLCLGELEGQIDVSGHGQAQASIGIGCTVSRARPTSTGLLGGLLGLGLLGLRRRATARR